MSGKRAKFIRKIAKKLELTPASYREMKRNWTRGHRSHILKLAE